MIREVELNAELRTGVGKGPARQARMAGNIPGVVYGPEIEPIPIFIPAKAFRAAVIKSGGQRGTGSTIFSLKVGDKTNKVLIRDLQRDPVTSTIIHIDFHAIAMNKPIHISVPINLIGIPVGVKVDGGIMQTTLRELEISCLPANIPQNIELDVSELSIGESVHVSDLEVENVKILTEQQRTIVVISAPTVLKSATEDEAEEGEEGVEVAEGAEGAAPAEGDAAKAEGADDKKDDKKEKKDEKKK